MFFAHCRAKKDVAASENVSMDLLMLCKGKQKGKGDKQGKGGDGKDDRKGKRNNDKGKDNAKATEHFESCCSGCEAWVT